MGFPVKFFALDHLLQEYPKLIHISNFYYERKEFFEKEDWCNMENQILSFKSKCEV